MTISVFDISAANGVDRITRANSTINLPVVSNFFSTNLATCALYSLCYNYLSFNSFNYRLKQYLFSLTNLCYVLSDTLQLFKNINKLY